jgi:PAS domain S-box-containing protein
LTLSREPSPSVSKNIEKKNRRAIFWILFLFACLFFSLSALAIYIYVAQIHRITSESVTDLTTIYQGKIQTIENWRQERIGDGYIIQTSSYMTGLVKKLLDNPDDAENREALITRLNDFLVVYQYKSFEIRDLNGELLLAYPEAADDRPAVILGEMADVIVENQPILTDLYLAKDSSTAFLDLMVPFDDPDALSSTPMAVCVLQNDANDFLYPTLQTWPVSSKSGETVLFRLDGDEVTFLNELRFVSDSALKFHFPANDPNLPAARILRGDTSVGEGIDYRGVSVFYGGDQIPDTNWYLLAKTDRDEVLADVRRQGWFLACILLLILTTDLSLAYTFIRRQRVAFSEELRDLQNDKKEISERYSVLLEGSNDIIVLLDENGMIADFNDRACEAYGYSPEEMRGLSIMDLRTEEFQQPVKKFIGRVKARGSLRGELEHKTKEGHIFPVEASVRHFLIHDRDHYLDIIRDITERKNSQTALELSETRYRGLVEHATDGIFTADENGIFVFANDVACNMLGFTREEILGKKVFDLISPESLAAEPTHYWEILDGEKSLVITERDVIRKDGSRLPVEISAFGLPEGKVQGIVRDISERIRHRKELEAALQQYQLLFEQSPIPSHIHNEKTGRILAVNEASISLYGYSRHEFLAMSVDQLEANEGQDNRKIDGKQQFLHLHRKKNCEVVEVEITPQRVIFTGSPCVRVMEVDVTERNKFEKALKENLGDLQSIIETSPLAMITTDLVGNVTLWNKAAEKMFGWRADEVLGKEPAYFPPEEKGMLASTLQKVLESKENLIYEGIRCHKNGRRLNVKIHATTIRDYKNEIKGSLAIISDETELKLIEAANLAMQEERDSLLSRLQLQFKNMPVGFILTDSNLNVVDWNPAAESIFGYSREEMIGKSEYGTLIPEDQKRLVQNVVNESILHNLTVVSTNENFHKDGHRIIVEWHNTPLRDDSGNLIAMMNMALDVTEKIEAENKLRESEEKLRTLFDSQLMGIISSDVNGHIFNANDAYLQIIGYSRAELESGKIRWDEITPREFLPIDEQAIQQAKREGLCTPYEKQYIRKDGTLVWVMVGFMLIGENRENSIAFILNITNRKKAEQELSKSETRYGDLFKNMMNGVAQCQMIYDDEGKEVDYINLKVNDTFSKLTGLEKIEGKRITEVIPNIRNDNPELFEIYGRVARSGKPESFETFVPALGIHYSIHVYSPETGYFTVVFEDITARKVAELEIRSKQELLNLTGSIAKVGGWEFDPKTGKGTWTDEVARIHDLDPADPTNVEIGTSFYRGQDKQKIEEAIKAASDNGMPYDLELELVSAKGVNKIVRTIGQPEVEDGKVVRVRGIFQDITELKRAEAEVKALNESLEQRVRERTHELQIANQELEAFTYSVSHDLRAPIRAIDGFSHIITEEHAEDIPPDVTHYLNLIRKNTQNMGHLVDDLLAFSRLGKQAVNKESVNITRLVKGIVADIKALETKRHIRFIVEKMPACEGDESLLKQVFVNLLSNAAKFSRSKDPATINVGICNARLRRPDGSLGEEIACYFVRDNGVGFDMRYYDKLFGVFQRLHSTDEYEGTGVGLAIVQRIVEKHNGIIWAESQVGVGTTFYFTLCEEKK